MKRRRRSNIDTVVKKKKRKQMDVLRHVYRLCGLLKERKWAFCTQLC
jgi:hypothetical protein